MMRLKPKARSGAMLLVLAAAIAGANTRTVAAQEVTTAERMLFLDKHFTITGKQTLTYLFRQEAGDVPAFNDTATVDVHELGPDGTASVTTKFLSGEHAIPIPPLERATGNPIILGFLESDIAKMKGLTGGSANYFRRRIRLALAAGDVRIREVQVDYDNNTVPAREITIVPYSSDSQDKRLGRYTEKAYVFVTSPQIPGAVYCIYTLASEPPGQTVDSGITIAGGDPKQCN